MPLRSKYNTMYIKFEGQFCVKYLSNSDRLVETNQSERTNQLERKQFLITILF